MAPEGFAEFFLASAGTGGAFVGLLFVAISIGPQRTFGDPAMAAPRQHLAEASFLTLANGFVVSSIALIPAINVGWVALGLGALGGATAVHLARRFARFHRHGPARRAPWPHLLRVAGPSLVAAAVYSVEGLLGLRLLLRPSDEAAFGWLAVIIIGLYALGIARAWTLLGDPRYGLSGWFNPLQDLAPRGEAIVPPDASSSSPSSCGNAPMRNRLAFRPRVNSSRHRRRLPPPMAGPQTPQSVDLARPAPEQ